MNCPSCGSENIEGSDRCENCLAPFRDLDVPSADSAEGLARHVMEDKLSGLEQETPLIVAPDTPAIDVARQMKELNTGCALVLDGPNLVGIFTEHDVLLKMCSYLMSDKGHKPALDSGNDEHDEAILKVPVKELMTTSPETLHEHESVAFALNKMSLGRFRHIPVEKNDGTYTVVSIKSVLKYIAHEDW